MPEAYRTRAAEFFERYEAIDAPDIRALLTRWIGSGSRVLELGCGSGRDARFMAGLGASVTACDGSKPLLTLARTCTPDGAGIDWIQAIMPPDPAAADTLTSSPFDAVYTCGLLQHLTDHELYETAAFIDRASGGNSAVIVVVPLDHQGDADRFVQARETLDYVALFDRMGFRKVFEAESVSGSPGYECRWVSLVFLRADGSDRAMKRLRAIIENDKKTSTYKLAVLRALCDVNRTMPRLVSFRNGKAELPAGIIAEKVIGYYWQLRSGTRMPKQIGGARELRFNAQLERLWNRCAGNRTVFASLITDGGRSPDARLADELFCETVYTLNRGPYVHTKDEDGRPIFTSSGPTQPRAVHITDRRQLLTAFGTVSFPAELWLELNRVAPWLEDSVILDWARLSAKFETKLGMKDAMTAGDIAARLLPAEEVRDTMAARGLYAALAEKGDLCCVWTGRPLTKPKLAVDHVLPWARFHSNDLWNLMPALACVNGSKSDAIPSADALLAAGPAIRAYWHRLDDAWHGRFMSEAETALTRTPLPAAHWETPLFDALLETADMAAHQLQARRWSPSRP